MMLRYSISGKNSEGNTFEGELTICNEGILEGKMYSTNPRGIDKEISGRFIFKNSEGQGRILLNFEERPRGNTICKNVDALIFSLEKEVRADSIEDMSLDEIFGEYIGIYSELEEDELTEKNPKNNSGAFYLILNPPKIDSLENQLNPSDAYAIAQEAIDRQLEREQKKEKIIIMYVPLKI